MIHPQSLSTSLGEPSCIGLSDIGSGSYWIETQLWRPEISKESEAILTLWWSNIGIEQSPSKKEAKDIDGAILLQFSIATLGGPGGVGIIFARPSQPWFLVGYLAQWWTLACDHITTTDIPWGKHSCRCGKCSLPSINLPFPIPLCIGDFPASHVMFDCLVFVITNPWARQFLPLWRPGLRRPNGSTNGVPSPKNHGYNPFVRWWPWRSIPEGS